MTTGQLDWGGDYEWPTDEEGEKALKAVKESMPCAKCHRKDCRCQRPHSLFFHPHRYEYKYAKKVY
jgi:hypothetical protein